MAIVTYDDVATDAYCAGTGRSLRSDRNRTRRLYRKFNCDLYAGDEYTGSGRILVTGSGLRRFKWLSWDEA